MTTPGASSHPLPATSWPAVFDGIGALVVNCALDPDQLVDRIPGLTWIAFKVGGVDVADDNETRHCRAVWEARGLTVGCWVDCRLRPATDVVRLTPWHPAFVSYDVEVAYKADEGGHYEYAAQLVAEHNRQLPGVPASVNSYGGYKSSIDFGAFAKAGWPIFAQVYDSFKPGDEYTYVTKALRVSADDVGGPYPAAGVHQLTRSLTLAPGEAVYRPESID